MIGKKEIWIFISHSSEDFNKVRKIRNYLEEKSYRPLMFYLKCLESDEEIYDLITREIDVRTRFILCDSENARSSYWVKKEMDYISNHEPPRSFLRIDLSQSDDVIHSQLDSYINQMNIFLSYPIKHHDLFNKIRSRLNKYDLKVIPDSDLTSGDIFAHTLEEQISYVANNGYFVLLYSKDITNSIFVTYEFELADKLGANMILITLDQESAHICNNNRSLGKYPHIDVSNSPEGDKPDAITNQILERILPVGGLMTFADNFRTGRLGVKDEDEATKLYKYLFDKAEKSDNPYALQYIGRCYEYGWLGNPIDLHKASVYYTMAILEPGGPKDETFLQHVRELNEKLCGNSPSEPKIRTSFIQRLKSIFK